MKGNVALAVITKYLDSLSPYIEFLENSRKYEHNIKELIIVYSHGKKVSVLKILEEKLNLMGVRLRVIKAVDDPYLYGRLKEMGLSSTAISNLISSPLLAEHGLLPYGYYRNVALVAALTCNPPVDILFFVDTDVYPWLLGEREGEYYFQEIDFFGRHLEYLRGNTAITSSDYSGYYIIPSFSFAGLKELLLGLQKEKAYIFLEEKKNLILASKRREIRPTEKLLGGNLALDLRKVDLFPPFFSTTYLYNGVLFLGRGEDTILGREVWQRKGQVMDIDLRIFHDTYGNFPWQPELKSRTVRDRFFYAAMGWLGRNPFLNWLAVEEFKMKNIDFEGRKEFQYENLKIGSKAIGDFLGDSRFYELPEAFLAAYTQLNEMIDSYYRTMESWAEFKTKVEERRVS